MEFWNKFLISINLKKFIYAIENFKRKLINLKNFHPQIFVNFHNL